MVGLLTLLLLAAGLSAATQHREAARMLLRGTRSLLLVELGFLLILAVLGAVYQSTSTVRDRRLHPPPGNLIDMGGYRLHLYCTGAGTPTVVLDYGLVGSYLDWHFVQPKIARFTRVCSYDRGGYGWSDPSPKPRLPSAQVEELHTLLEKAGEKPPFVLVGHSLGGFDALMYAHRYRDEVAAVVLIDSTHPDGRMVFDLRNKVWLRFLQFTAPLGLPRWRRWCTAGPEPLRPLKAAFNCAAKVYRTEYQQWAAFAGAAQEIRSIRSLGVLPLAVISRDPNRKPKRPEGMASEPEQTWSQFQQDLARFSSNSTQVIAEGSGHGIPTERPEIVAQVIEKLVRRN